MRQTSRYINTLATILKASLKDAVVALCRLGRWIHNNTTKFIYAVGRFLGLIKGDIVKTLPDDSETDQSSNLLADVCPVISKDSVRLRFILSIGDGVLSAHCKECA